jgi:hypothetical protein
VGSSPISSTTFPPGTPCAGSSTRTCRRCRPRRRDWGTRGPPTHRPDQPVRGRAVQHVRVVLVRRWPEEPIEPRREARTGHQFGVPAWRMKRLQQVISNWSIVGGLDGCVRVSKEASSCCQQVLASTHALASEANGSLRGLHLEEELRVHGDPLDLTDGGRQSEIVLLEQVAEPIAVDQVDRRRPVPTGSPVRWSTATRSRRRRGALAPHRLDSALAIVSAPREP